MIQLIRGFKDVLPGEVELWQAIEKTAISVFDDFGFKEIRIPIIEKTELFSRSIGDNTDIVEKEMYTFSDRKGDLITLRPEATASVVRSYIQHKLYTSDPVQKFYTIGPMFRRERPQQGRYRQFYQINAEIFGIDSPLADVQLIFLLVTLFSRLAVPDVETHINSLGCPICRPGFKQALIDFLSKTKVKLCSDCIRRSKQNPLRVLDCKVPSCREAMAQTPSLLDFLCYECVRDFKILTDSLEHLNISFIIDKRLVRGLDYYTRATFEIQTGFLGAQSAVAGGGRYDGLVEALGGPDLPATGFAIGLDRLTEISDLQIDDYHKTPQIFIAALGQKSKGKAFEWGCSLNKTGIRAEMDFGEKSLKSQMKRANKLGASHVLIVGEKELTEGSAVLRDMMTKKQVFISTDAVIENVSRKLGALPL